jgi:adenylate cyclase
VLVIVLLAGLPLAVWLDLRTLTQNALLAQANDFDTVISGIRAYYADHIVKNVLDAPKGTPATVRHDYASHPGAIPIPATFSLELGDIVSGRQGSIRYRFISHYPFRGRAAHRFDRFEDDALAALERNHARTVESISWHGLSSEVRYVTPIIMGPTCVACHNSSPDSPKRDWKVGDVRGIQELEITQPLARNVFSFKYLLTYFLIAGALGIGLIAFQRRQTLFLGSIAARLSHYLSPQIYRSIFSGSTTEDLSTKRKKLSIFFSDIRDFTASSERLQPEQLTALLNEYFSEMSAIALEYGGTIDKFVGDAMLVFFGDPESRGEAEDAKAALRMAAAMQRKLAELNAKWRASGVEHPFEARMAINTGYCNVGNFGSRERMDYTIIGAEANLAARLQSIAAPGSIVVSYETLALVREIVVAHPLDPLHVKGISREVRPFAVDSVLDASGGKNVFSEHGPGIDLYLDPNLLDEAQARRARDVLRAALEALDAP